MTSLTRTWPEATLAVAVVVLVAYLVADIVARLVQSVLRTVIEDDELEHLLVDRPRRLVRLAIFLVTGAALLFPALSLAGHPTRFGGSPEAVLQWLLDAGLRIAIIVVVAYAVVRVGSAAARRFEREMARGHGHNATERAKRARTLGRLLQNALSALVIVIAGLMVLRELRVDITPALTGAGIAGLAIGFGAQTIVRDVISGFFLILEDQCRVGDVAVVNGQAGLVEQVNLRTIVLRDDEGTVHVFPNGEVKTLANKSKDFSYFVLSFGVGYDDDPAMVIQAMREAGDAVAADPVLGEFVMEPIEVLGIEALEPSQVVVKARIKTEPLKQWVVGREVRRHLVRLFAERGIAPPTGRTIVTLERRDASPAP